MFHIPQFPALSAFSRKLSPCLTPAVLIRRPGKDLTKLMGGGKGRGMFLAGFVIERLIGCDRETYLWEVTGRAILYQPMGWI